MLTRWSRIQAVVALSSGEAELYAAIAGMTRGLGILHLVRDLWGPTWGKLVHCVDSAACKSIVSRKGSGSIKHLATKDLWVQEARRIYEVEMRKIPREENASDSLASFSTGPTLAKHLKQLNCSVFYFAPVKSYKY